MGKKYINIFKLEEMLEKKIITKDIADRIFIEFIISENGLVSLDVVNRIIKNAKVYD